MSTNEIKEGELVSRWIRYFNLMTLLLFSRDYLFILFLFLIYNENGKKIKHQVIMICYNREILATKSYIVED